MEKNKILKESENIRSRSKYYLTFLCRSTYILQIFVLFFNKKEFLQVNCDVVGNQETNAIIVK